MSRMAGERNQREKLEFPTLLARCKPVGGVWRSPLKSLLTAFRPLLLFICGRPESAARIVAFCSFAVVLGGCSRPIPRDSLVLTQRPNAAHSEPAQDALDLRYPPGSRVVLAAFSRRTPNLRVLSSGLLAAGEPVLSYDGRRVVFAGKKNPAAEWQIYESSIEGGSIKVLTKAPGGAMDPALLSDGSLLYISPVPGIAAKRSRTRRSALYVQPPSGEPRQLTFSSADIFNPTVLADGRILFVSSQPSEAAGSRTGLALYTINNDGTEVTAFAGQHNEPTIIQRPRQLEDGRIVFVVPDSAGDSFGKAECIWSARPFGNRSPLFPNASVRVSSVEAALNGDLLVCAEPGDSCTNDCHRGVVFQINSTRTSLGVPILEDLHWSTLESLPATASRRPMGRLSNLDLSRKTGQILCLDGNNTTYDLNRSGAKATRVRIFTAKQSGVRFGLGEVDLQADGSFMAEVPADIPLGFEALNRDGQVLRQVEPLVWVRPGENRSCIGCHEPHNHSPRNSRPLAVRVPVQQLLGEPPPLTQKEPDP